MLEKACLDAPALAGEVCVALPIVAELSPGRGYHAPGVVAGEVGGGRALNWRFRLERGALLGAAGRQAQETIKTENQRPEMRDQTITPPVVLAFGRGY